MSTCDAVNFPDRAWRLIPLLDAPGEVQMALDRWLFEQHALGLHPPTLRFYTWSPVAISLGYHQTRFPDAWKKLVWQDQPVDLVRRPSGGRAVLHQGDLTYAVIASGFSRQRAIAYQEICEFLIAGWRSLSVELHYGTTQRGYIHNPNCFGTATAADLVTAIGTKLIGSAQLRQGNTILQHGSMRLSPDRALFQQVFPAESQFLSPHLPTPPEIITALTAAAAQTFQIQLLTQPLTPSEWQTLEGRISLEKPGLLKLDTNLESEQSR
jgi:lipoate---protein ligase